MNNNVFSILLKISVLLFIGNTDLSGVADRKTEIILKPAGSALMTEIIQQAVDKCDSEGGGIVHFTQGTYFSGTIMLKSKVTLQLDKGVLLQGSDKYTDYRNDAFFYGKDLSDITISGEGVIDGVDCYNPKGEEGFRGPHCIKLLGCRNIKLSGITIKNSANWAVNCRKCSYGIVTNVTILAGHDGLHTRFCDNFTVKGCDFRTGDDAFAGNDNHDFKISGCSINTSCNGFRMGCLNLSVEKCRFWGPGEYIHKIQKRTNMLSAFVHFSPKDENPKLQSGNWVIKDITVENVDNFYVYNFRNGLWQTGQPATSISFEKVMAKGLLSAFYIEGDTSLLFNLKIRNSSFSFREEADKNPDAFEGARMLSGVLFYAKNFNVISIEKTAFLKQDTSFILKAESGNKIILEKTSFNTGSEIQPFSFKMINNIEMNKVTHNNTDVTGKPLKPIMVKVPGK